MRNIKSKVILVNPYEVKLKPLVDFYKATDTYVVFVPCNIGSPYVQIIDTEVAFLRTGLLSKVFRFLRRYLL